MDLKKVEKILKDYEIETEEELEEIIKAGYTMFALNDLVEDLKDNVDLIFNDDVGTD